MNQKWQALNAYPNSGQDQEAILFTTPTTIDIAQHQADMKFYDNKNERL